MITSLLACWLLACSPFRFPKPTLPPARRVPTGRDASVRAARWAFMGYGYGYHPGYGYHGGAAVVRRPGAVVVRRPVY